MWPSWWNWSDATLEAWCWWVPRSRISVCLPGARTCSPQLPTLNASRITASVRSPHRSSCRSIVFSRCTARSRVFWGYSEAAPARTRCRHFFGAPEATIGEFAEAMIRVGLAEVVDEVFLRWNPALGAVVDGELSDVDRQTARAAFQSTYWRLTELLDKNAHENAKTASSLAMAETPNLLLALDQLSETRDFANTAMMAARVENILQPVATKRTLDRIAAIRASAASELQTWDASRFAIEKAAVDELLGSDRTADAVELAKNLLNRAQAAGENAYPGAPRDIAVAQVHTGHDIASSRQARCRGLDS